MKIIFIGLFLATTITFNSCNSPSASDIKVVDLQTTCEHIDAMHQVLDEVIQINDSEKKDWDDLDRDTKKLIEDLIDKWDEIVQSSIDMDFEKEDFEECADQNWENTLKKKVRKCPLFFISNVDRKINY